MTDPNTRLGEARKQIRIVAADLGDEELRATLERADALVEGVRGDVTDRNDDTDAGG